MAEWYWRANDKSKAIVMQQKAIEALKGERQFSAADLADFDPSLSDSKNQRLQAVKYPADYTAAGFDRLYYNSPGLNINFIFPL